MSDEELAEALQEIEQTGRLRAEQIQHRDDGAPIHVDSLTVEWVMSWARQRII